MTPGELLTDDGDHVLNPGRRTATVVVQNTADRPIQVGSHYHFAETNGALQFDRDAARGMRLNIASGTAVRFEPGQQRTVELVDYAGERKVFGAPLIDYPLTCSKLARSAARYAACRYLTYAVARLLNEGGGRMEASMVKLFACRSAEMVTRDALQIHGGMGYAEETAVSRYFVDARVLSIFEGAEETLALKVVARSLLESALLPKAA